MMTIGRPFTTSDRDVLHLMMELSESLSTDLVVDSVSSDGDLVTVRFGQPLDTMPTDCPEAQNE